jgi:hypothetical protein
MRLDGLDHPKTLELAARLGVSKPTAIGHLELLWAFVGKLATQGNIGKYGDGAIARAAEWQGDPTAFVDGLLLAGFLDECGTHRLVVHDWSEHCPSWVRAKAKRARLELLAKGEPTKGPSRVSTIEATIDGLETVSVPDLHPDYVRARVPSQAKRSQAYIRTPTSTPTIVDSSAGPPPEPTRAAEWDYAGRAPPTAPVDDDIVAAFGLIRARMPKRPGRGHNWILGERAWRQRIDEGEDPKALHAGVERYAQYVEGGGISSDAYVIGIDQFFNSVDRPWQQSWELPTQLRGGSGRKTLDDYKIPGRGEDL